MRWLGKGQVEPVGEVDQKIKELFRQNHIVINDQQPVMRDLAAVRAALSLPWSTGPVEGQISRLKTIKRAMCGRAGFELLRQRILQGA